MIIEIDSNNPSRLVLDSRKDINESLVLIEQAEVLLSLLELSYQMLILLDSSSHLPS